MFNFPQIVAHVPSTQPLDSSTRAVTSIDGSTAAFQWNNTVQTKPCHTETAWKSYGFEKKEVSPCNEMAGIISKNHFLTAFFVFWLTVRMGCMVSGSLNVVKKVGQRPIIAEPGAVSDFVIDDGWSIHFISSTKRNAHIQIQTTSTPMSLRSTTDVRKTKNRCF